MPTFSTMPRMKMLWFALAFATLATLFLAACGGTTTTASSSTTAATSVPPTATQADTPTPQPTASTAPAAAPTQVVQVKIVEVNNQYSFQPATISIPKGAQIVWTNSSDAPHTVTSDTSAFSASDSLNMNDTFKMVFSTPGTFAYHCSIHPYMKATITVTG